MVRVRYNGHMYRRPANLSELRGLLGGANPGTDPLAGSATLGSVTSGEYALAPTSLKVRAGGTQTVTVTYSPRLTADAGAPTVSTNDPEHPTVVVTLSGTGVIPSGSSSTRRSTAGASGSPPPPAGRDGESRGERQRWVARGGRCVGELRRGWYTAEAIRRLQHGEPAGDARGPRALRGPETARLEPQRAAPAWRRGPSLRSSAGSTRRSQASLQYG